ncbi:MAG: hypothetical protein ACC645_21340, partial [Pirellulales bacterium]
RAPVGRKMSQTPIRERLRPSFGRRRGRPAGIVCAALIGTLLTSRIPTAEGQVSPVAIPQSAATPISVNGSRPSEPLLRQAATAVESQPSLRAMLRLKAQILDNELVGSGLYLQQGRGVEMLTRLELRLQTGDEATGLLRINDGRYVWTDRRSGSQRWVTSVDLRRLREAGQGGEGGVEQSIATDVAAPQFELVGGLTDLLNSLEATFQFGDPQPHRIGKLPVYQLTGTWRPFMLARFLPDQADAILAGQPANLDALPAHIPTEVVLLLGHDNLFPYVIDYRRDRHRSLLRIEWYEIQFGGAIDPKRFVFHSRGEGAKDITDQVIQRRVALRRMERK